MKILVFTENFFPDMGGLERNTYTIASTLASLGHDVTVLTGTLKEDNDTYPFKVVRSKSYSSYIATVKNTDLVVMNGGIALKVCVAAHFYNKPYLPIYVTSNLFFSQVGGIKGKVNTQIRQFLASKARINIALSGFAKRSLEQHLPQTPAVMLQNPIDGALEAIAKAKSKNPVPKVYDVLFAGRMIEGKGIFILIDALVQINSLLRGGLKVAFAGIGDDQERLVQYAKDQNVAIDYLGRLGNEAMIDAYLKSKVLVVPSSTHIEGNPLVIAEAISLGVPVVASNQDAMIEAVGDAGYIFKSGEATDLAEKLKWLFVDKHLAEKTQNTITRKAIFSYDYYKMGFHNIIEQVERPKKSSEFALISLL